MAGGLSRWLRRSLVAAAALTVMVAAALVAGGAAISGAGPSGGPNGPSHVAGVVQVSGQPSPGWTVELYAGSPSGSQLIDSTTAGTDGVFRLRTWPRARDAVVQYLVATRGADEKLLVVVGTPAETPSDVVVNELTAIASIWTNAQFIDGNTVAGNAVGLAAAARNVSNLVDLAAGTLGSVVLDTASLRTNTAATMGTLAGLLGTCISDGCPTLFGYATPPGADAPADTLEAFLDIALNPWHNVTEIFSLLQPATDGAPDNPHFLPTLLFPPTAWTLSLVYTEGGFNAPGRLGIDAEGNVWANNNFMVGSQSVLLDLGGVYTPDPDTYFGNGIVKLASDGTPMSPRTGFLGGGVFGSAFGLAVDEQGHVWIGNFAGDSVSELAPNGSPISPSSMGYSSEGGYHHRSLDDPQSTIVTEDGSVWLPNLGGNTVTQLVGGDPENIRAWGGSACAVQFSRPWGLASDANGFVYVTNVAGRSVSVIDPGSDDRPLCPVASHVVNDLAGPQGLATDMEGNLWVANTYGEGSVTFLDAADDFEPTTFTADGTTVGPWSVAVDGADNVWIADFFGRRIENLCGASGNCPEGMQELGSRISPAGTPESEELGMGGGYGANGSLQHITSVNIDQAGNVWLANNFANNRECLRGAGIPDPGEGGSTVGQERTQTTCGGNGVVVMFGVAAPVSAPQIGLPSQP